uniref:PA-like protein n=1 Tax=Insect orthomyxo-like virus 1 TaxID=2819085 RepID=A0A7H1D360_9ORTO|nr:PA-like protein [Insect orthomyxo-like virus 1]
MDDDPYCRLIMDSGIYEKDFVKTFGESETHWFVASWRSRENSLRHDLVCVYLCNMEPYTVRKRRALSQLKYLSKKAKSDVSLPSTSTADTQFETVTDDNEDEDSEMRFILLEARGGVAELQSTFAKKWGVPIPRKKWDIIDKKERKFLEVKVTRNIGMAVINFNLESAGHKEFSLFAINPEDPSEFRWVNHTGDVVGFPKVTTFLSVRKLFLDGLHVMESDLGDHVDMAPRIFCSSWFNFHMDTWSDEIWRLRNLKAPSNYGSQDGPPVVDVTCEALLNGLEDPRRREGDIVRWKGKILPEPMVDNIITESLKDEDMVQQFFDIIGVTECPLVNRLAYLWAKKKNNFELLKKDDYRDPFNKELMVDLGIGMRKRLHKPEAETFAKEKDERELCRAHPWFDHMIQELCAVQTTGRTFNNLQLAEFQSIHPVGKIAQGCVDSVMDVYTNTELSVFASKITNFYTRLGRNYSPNAMFGQAYRDNTVVFPINSTQYKPDKTKVRCISGICIRGPSHAKKPTDKINFITVEILATNDEYYHDKIHKSRLIKTATGLLLCYRANSLERDDPNHLIFINNACFMTCNLVGEILLTKPGRKNRDFQNEVQMFVNTYQHWIRERLCESILMACLGRSQEEGYFAQLRKIYMLLVAIRRRKRAQNWDIEKLCEKTNECLIDGPLNMSFHVSLLALLKSHRNEHFCDAEAMLGALSLE